MKFYDIFKTFEEDYNCGMTLHLRNGAEICIDNNEKEYEDYEIDEDFITILEHRIVDGQDELCKSYDIPFSEICYMEMRY